MEVTFWAWAHRHNGKYFYGGNDFPESLFIALEKTKEYSSNNKNFNLLFSEIEKKEINEHNHDFIDRLFRENTFLDFEFCKSLSLYDILCADCFKPKNNIGEAIIELLNYSCFEFTFYYRKWIKSNQLEIEFIATHEDYSRNVHAYFTKKNE